MPADVRASLVERGVLDDYRSRPTYQRNDYLGWIAAAKHPDTRRRRIEQMLDELELGGMYMKMKHPPSRKG
jgi:uncharacterized protein YdeI (YjbR/CyaY-like superfamily)